MRIVGKALPEVGVVAAWEVPEPILTVGVAVGVDPPVNGLVAKVGVGVGVVPEGN